MILTVIDATPTSVYSGTEKKHKNSTWITVTEAGLLSSVYEVGLVIINTEYEMWVGGRGREEWWTRNQWEWEINKMDTIITHFTISNSTLCTKENSGM